MVAALDVSGELPAETTPDVEGIMQQVVSWRESELLPVYKALLAIGIPIDIAEIGAIARWVATDD